MGLRATIENDLQDTLEGAFSLPVVLIDVETGLKVDTSVNDGLTLAGQVMFDTVINDPETGMEIVTNKPVVSLRRSSLSSAPTDINYERWLVEIPDSPQDGASVSQYRIGRPPEGGRSHGFVRLYLERVEQ